MPSLHRRVSSELLTLRQTLKAFDRSLRRIAPMFSAAMSMNGAPKGNGRSRPRLSAKGRASLVLQGRYMGYMVRPERDSLIMRSSGAVPG